MLNIFKRKKLPLLPKDVLILCIEEDPIMTLTFWKYSKKIQSYIIAEYKKYKYLIVEKNKGIIDKCKYLRITYEGRCRDQYRQFETFFYNHDTQLFKIIYNHKFYNITKMEWKKVEVDYYLYYSRYRLPYTCKKHLCLCITTTEDMFSDEYRGGNK